MKKGFEIRCFIETKDDEKQKKVGKMLTAMDFSIFISEYLFDKGIEPNDDMIHVSIVKKG